MTAINEALSIAGFGVLVVFAALLLLLAAIRLLGSVAGTGGARAVPTAPTYPGRVDPAHLACIAAAIVTLWAEAPARVDVRRVD